MCDWLCPSLVLCCDYGLQTEIFISGGRELRRWRYLDHDVECSESSKMPRSLSEAVGALDSCWRVSSGGAACKVVRECQGCSCREVPPMLGWDFG